jgi:hypothetical protein
MDVASGKPLPHGGPGGEKYGISKIFDIEDGFYLIDQIMEG